MAYFFLAWYIFNIFHEVFLCDDYIAHMCMIGQLTLAWWSINFRDISLLEIILWDDYIACMVGQPSAG